MQLLRRYWRIQSCNGKQEIVSGEGVVGETPILKSGEVFQYISACPLNTPIGQMSGYFTFVDYSTKNEFIIPIEKFTLISPTVYN